MGDGCGSKDDGIAKKINEMIKKNLEAGMRRRKHVLQIRHG
jgi:hypothetical protein